MRSRSIRTSTCWSSMRRRAPCACAGTRWQASCHRRRTRRSAGPWIGRSPCTSRRSRPIRTMRPRSTTWRRPIWISTSPTSPSPTSARPSRPTRSWPRPTTTAASCAPSPATCGERRRTGGARSRSSRDVGRSSTISPPCRPTPMTRGPGATGCRSRTGVSTPRKASMVSAPVRPSSACAFA